MWTRRKEEEVDALHAEAIELVESGELERAEAIARELEGFGWSGAFEVFALVARARGEIEVAIAHLDRGLLVAPEAWALHQLRGNLLDQAGRGVDALAAYDAALACSGAWVSSVRYNRAVTRLSTGDSEGALADAESVMADPSSAPFAVSAVSLAVEALLALARPADAVSLAERVLAGADDAATAGVLEGLLAHALLGAGRPEVEVRAACARAIELDGGDTALARVLRALCAPRTVTSYRVTVDVHAPELLEGAVGYLRILEVAASDEAEARALALSLEPTRRRGAARVDEITNEGPPADRPGVVHASGRIFYGA